MNIKNLKIIELASVLAGPSVGMFFSELGAEVIKIENKKEGGDITRKWKLENENKKNSISAYYSSVNYNKKNIFLDFFDTNDKEIVKEYVRKCDIVIVNFKQNDYDKFKLNYEDLIGLNSKIIYAKIIGFSEENPRLAYDLVLQAETGFMSMNGQKNSLPTKFPVAIIDLFAAHQLKEGILVALLEQQSDNKPKKVTVSLFESAIASLANQASNFLMENYIPERQGSHHPNIAPYGEIYITKDSKEFTIAIGSDRQFEDLVNYLQITENELFKTNQNRIKNRTILQKKLQEKFNLIDSKTLKKDFENRNIPFGFIKNLKEVFEEKSAQELILEEEMEGIQTKRIKSVVFKIE